MFFTYSTNQTYTFVTYIRVMGFVKISNPSFWNKNSIDCMLFHWHRTEVKIHVSAQSGTESELN